MKLKYFFLIASIMTISALTGCRTGIWGNEEVPVVKEQPVAPAPIVVDGVRATYADVVDKTSPAVVQIEARQQAQQTAVPKGRAPGEDLLRQFGFPEQPQRPQI
jgi:hypothetical protein